MTAFSEKATAYLREHAILPEVAARIGVHEEPGVLVWPTVDGDGKPSPRRRDLTGRGPKVRGTSGRSLAPWWPGGAPERAAAVLVAEGESDALAACCALASPEDDADGSVRVLRSFVSAVVCVPGTSFPADRLAAALAAVEAREVVLVLDGDQAGRDATGRYWAALTAAGMRVIRVELSEGSDLAACLAREEGRPAAWLANVIADAEGLEAEGTAEAAAEPVVNGFRLLSPDDLLSLPDPSWLIDGLIPAEGLSVLYGASGSGKSFVALDWALCVASGLPWFGREVERRPVVYVAAEGRAGLGARYRAWSASRGRPDASGMWFLPEAVNLLDADVIAKARRTLDALPTRPGLLVVDTMARSMVGADENAAKDVGEFIAAVDGLRGENAALVVHHAGKDGGLERGSSALRAAADLMAKVTREPGRRLVLSCDKMKDAAPWDAMSFRLEDAAGSCALSMVVETVAARDDLHDAALAVLIAADGPLSMSAIARTAGKRKAAVSAALEALERLGQARSTPEGWIAVPVAREPHVRGPWRRRFPAGGQGRSPPRRGTAPGRPVPGARNRRRGGGMSADLPRDPFAGDDGQVDVLEDGARLFGVLVDLLVRGGLGPFAAAISALDEQQAKRIVIGSAIELDRTISAGREARRGRGRLRRSVRAAVAAARTEWKQ